MKNLKLKSQQGFTLVEVIVVAVIVAILAGVSIPLYLGYINNSRENSASNAAGSAASFGAACINGGRDFSLLTTSPVTGDGTAKLTCMDGATEVAALIIPTDVTITISGTNAVTGKHEKGGATSSPYTFTTAAPTPPPPTP